MEPDLSRLAGRYRQIPEAFLLRARELRKQSTSAEQLLWICLRGRRLQGAKFRRQHNIGRFIVDFYCHEAQLVIELDGAIHQGRQEQDAERDTWMIANGFTVLRFENETVWRQLEAVLDEICFHLSKSPAYRDKDLK